MSGRRISSLALLCGALASLSASPPGDPAVPGSAREPVLLARDTISLPGTHESVSAFLGDDRALITRCEADFRACRILEAAASGGSWRVLGPAEFAPAAPAAGAVPSAGKPAFFVFHSTPATPGAGTGADWKIWQAVRSGNGWERKLLPAPVNTSARECCVAVAGAGGALYFSSDRDGAWEIFRAAPAGDGAWTVAKLPAEINASPHGQWPSQSGPGERHLLFSSIRKTGYGGDDIYVAFREGASWTPARALPPPINSAAYEDGARVSPDGKRLIFSSTRPQPGDESANVYAIGLGELLTPSAPRR